MAITFNTLASINSSTDTDPYTTGSVTPTTGSVVFVAVANAKGTVPETPTIEAGAWGIDTWTLIGTSGTYNSNQRRLTCYWGYASSYSADTCSITFGATQIGCQATFFQAAGLDTSAPVATGNVDGDTGTATATSALNLAARSSTDNAIVAIAAHNASEGKTITGYTELYDLSAPGSPVMGLLAAYLTNADDTTVDISWATSAAFRALAFEVQAENAGGFGINGVRSGVGRWRRPAALLGG